MNESKIDRIPITPPPPPQTTAELAELLGSTSVSGASAMSANGISPWPPLAYSSEHARRRPPCSARRQIRAPWPHRHGAVVGGVEHGGRRPRGAERRGARARVGRLDAASARGAPHRQRGAVPLAAAFRSRRRAPRRARHGALVHCLRPRGSRQTTAARAAPPSPARDNTSRANESSSAAASPRVRPREDQDVGRVGRAAYSRAQSAPQCRRRPTARRILTAASRRARRAAARRRRAARATARRGARPPTGRRGAPRRRPPRPPPSAAPRRGRPPSRRRRRPGRAAYCATATRAAPPSSSRRAISA